MSSKIKNIIILVGVAVVLGLVYFIFIKKAPEQPSLISESGGTIPGDTSTETEPSITKEFLTLLLNVRNIKINDQVLYDPAFSSLRDSTIEIIDDGSEGRPNPFAPVGTDITANASNALLNIGSDANKTTPKNTETTGIDEKNKNTNTENNSTSPDGSTQ